MNLRKNRKNLLFVVLTIISLGDFCFGRLGEAPAAKEATTKSIDSEQHDNKDENRKELGTQLKKHEQPVSENRAEISKLTGDEAVNFAEQRAKMIIKETEKGGAKETGEVGGSDVSNMSISETTTTPGEELLTTKQPKQPKPAASNPTLDKPDIQDKAEDKAEAYARMIVTKMIGEKAAACACTNLKISACNAAPKCSTSGNNCLCSSANEGNKEEKDEVAEHVAKGERMIVTDTVVDAPPSVNKDTTDDSSVVNVVKKLVEHTQGEIPCAEPPCTDKKTLWKKENVTITLCGDDEHPCPENKAESTCGDDDEHPCSEDKAESPCGDDDEHPCTEDKAESPCGDDDENPCPEDKAESPCGNDENPCSQDKAESPCGDDEKPCSQDKSSKNDGSSTGTIEETYTPSTNTIEETYSPSTNDSATGVDSSSSKLIKTKTLPNLVENTDSSSAISTETATNDSATGVDSSSSKLIKTKTLPNLVKNTDSSSVISTETAKLSTKIDETNQHHPRMKPLVEITPNNRIPASDTSPKKNNVYSVVVEGMASIRPQTAKNKNFQSQKPIINGFANVPGGSSEEKSTNNYEPCACTNLETSACDAAPKCVTLGTACLCPFLFGKAMKTGENTQNNNLTLQELQNENEMLKIKLKEIGQENSKVSSDKKRLEEYLASLEAKVDAVDIPEGMDESSPEAKVDAADIPERINQSSSEAKVAVVDNPEGSGNLAENMNEFSKFVLDNVKETIRRRAEKMDSVLGDMQQNYAKVNEKNKKLEAALRMFGNEGSSEANKITNTLDSETSETSRPTIYDILKTPNDIEQNSTEISQPINITNTASQESSLEKAVAPRFQDFTHLNNYIRQPILQMG